MRPAGVVDHDTEPPVRRDRRLARRGDIARGRDIALNRGRVRPDRSRHLLRSLTVEIEDRDLGAFAPEGLGDAGPEPRCAAGDQCDLARKTHGTILPDAELE